MSVSSTHLRVVPAALLALFLAGCSASTDPDGPAAATATDPATTAAGDAAHVAWSYDPASGPDTWGDVAATCADGGAQSPVDLQPATFEAGTGDQAPQFAYRPTTFTVVNNGHTVEGVPDDTGADTMTLDGTVYELQQFHLHDPSEHTLDGEHAAMELHLVHQDAAGDVAVVAVLLQVGAENAALADFFAAMPADPTGDEDETEADLPAPLDLSAVLPAGSAAARYTGSLTTPPCTEGVRWTVLETPGEVSADQLAAFTALYPDDHRPTQDLGDRVVTEVTG